MPIGLGIGLGMQFSGGSAAVAVSMPADKFLEWKDGAFYTDTGMTTLATANGNNVKGMNDQTANNRDGTQASGNPTYLTSQFGTKGGASFSSNSPIDSGSIFGSGFDTAFTAFTVMRNKASSTLRVSHAGASLRYYAANQGFRATLYTALGGITYYGPCEALAPGIQVIKYDGANVTMYWQSQALHGNFATAKTGNLALTGAMAFGNIVGGGFPWEGVMGHFTLYQRALTTQEISDSLSALASTYGITERTKQAICYGDSLTWGLGAGLGSGYPEQLGTLLGSTWGVANCGFSSQTIANMDARKASDLQAVYDAAKTKNIVIVWLGTNDINAGTAGATAYAAYKALCAALQAYGYYVIAATIIKRSTFDAAKETERGVFNTALMAETLAGSGAFNARIDPGAHASLQNTADATYYTDGTHLTAAGYAIIAGLANTAVAAA